MRRVLYYIVFILIALNMVMIALNGLGIVAYRFNTITSYLSRIAILIFIIMFVSALIEFKRTKDVQTVAHISDDPAQASQTPQHAQVKQNRPAVAQSIGEQPRIRSTPINISPPREPHVGTRETLAPHGTASTQQKPTHPLTERRTAAPQPVHSTRSRDISVQRRRRKIQL